jgi:hypothetical protein
MIVAQDLLKGEGFTDMRPVVVDRAGGQQCSRPG